MARVFAVEVEGLSPEISDVMVKNALDSALDKFRKNWIAKKVTKREIKVVLDQLDIRQIKEITYLSDNDKGNLIDIIMK